MRNLRVLFFTVILCLCTHVINAQDVTSTYITNPSFETGDNTGWTITGADGYAWTGPNTDGDATKDGSYISGVWNSTIGDVEWSQTIADLPNGFYNVACVMTVTHNAGLRLSTQRLYANNKSVLYAAEGNYPVVNIDLLKQTENVAFAGNSTSAAENGAFFPMNVIVEVTDGNLQLGTRVNGSATQFAFDFANLGTDIGFFKWDNFSLTNVSSLLINTLSIDGVAIDGIDPTSVLLHEMFLEEGTTVAPTVTATAPTGATVDIIPPSSLPGKTEIVITSEDGSYSLSYFVGFKFNASDATLSSITADIGVLSPEFNPIQTDYDLLVPFGTDMVDFDIVTSNKDATLTIFDSNANQIGADGIVPVDVFGADVEIIVLSADESAEVSYYVAINVDGDSEPKNADLSGIVLSDGILSPAFDKDSTEYNVLLPIGTSSVTLTATTLTDLASKVGDEAVTITNGHGRSDIKVTSGDGTVIKTYTFIYDYNYLENPSFETGDLTGWTLTGADGYAWNTPNKDADGTQDGDWIAGVWNQGIGDVEWNQNITNLPNGFYKVGCLMTVMNSVSSQRLFANEKSVLYGEERNYTTEDLTLLRTTENLSFGGYATSSSDRGTFKLMNVIVEVTDGTLNLGTKTNGNTTVEPFSFKSDVNSTIGFFKFDNLSVSNVSDLLINTLAIDGVAIDGIVSTEESSLTFHCLPLPKVSILVIGIGQENWGPT